MDTSIRWPVSSPKQKFAIDREFSRKLGETYRVATKKRLSGQCTFPAWIEINAKKVI